MRERLGIPKGIFARPYASAGFHALLAALAAAPSAARSMVQHGLDRQLRIG
jgi:hypothetical protein